MISATYIILSQQILGVKLLLILIQTHYVSTFWPPKITSNNLQSRIYCEVL